MGNTTKRLFVTLLMIAYSAALIAYVGPDSWMWMVWVPAWLAVSAPAIWMGLRDGKAGWIRVVLPWSAGITLSVVLVLSAVLESRFYENLGRVFWPLGIGMAAAVAVLLASYDRSKRPAAESD